MKPEFLIDNFERLAEAPDGINQIKKGICSLAISGRLMGQHPSDEPAQQLRNRLRGIRDSGEFDRIAKRKPAEPLEIDDDEIPHLVPSTWCWVRLSELGQIVGGGTPSTTDGRNFADGGVPWVGPADLGKLSTNFVSKGARDLSENGLEKSSAQLMPKGTVIFSSRAPIGYVAIASNPIATNQGCKSCVPYAEGMSSYLHLFLSYAADQIAANASGTTFKEISGRLFGELLVPLPPLAEQARIVARVDELMAKCDELEKRQEAARETRVRVHKASLNSLVEATTPDELSTAWQRLSDNFNALHDTPESFERLRNAALDLLTKPPAIHFHPSIGPVPKASNAVGDYVSVQNGFAFKSSWYQSKGVKLLRNANIGPNFVDWEQVQHVSQERAKEFERFALHEGDIVISLDRPLISTGTKVARLSKDDVPSLLLQRVGRVIFEGEELVPEFFLLWLRSPAFAAAIDPGRSKGVPHISSKQIEAIPFNPPSLEEQKSAIATLSSLDAMMTSIFQRAQIVEDLRGSFSEATAQAIAVKT